MQRIRRRGLALVAALLALNAVLVAAQPGAALPRSLATYFFGPKLVRAEIVMKDAGVPVVYRVDRGRIRAVHADAVTLLERDGTLVVVPVAADARVTLNGRPLALAALRRGTVATTIRTGEAPAGVVQARRG